METLNSWKIDSSNPNDGQESIYLALAVLVATLWLTVCCSVQKPTWEACVFTAANIIFHLKRIYFQPSQK